jgi:hypothetical protein
MTTFITDREAAALREDSLSYIGNVATKRLPGKPRIYGPVRMRMRVCGRRQRCRACGQFIENRAPVIQFRWAQRTWRDAAYIHQECPDIGSPHGAD